MIALSELQRRFAHGLLEDQPEWVEDFVHADGFSAAARLSVYRNNVYAGLRGALQTCFPVVRRLVGEDYFRQAAHDYISAHPSRSGDVSRFGAGFPAHLGALESARSLLYLEDVARLEWARQEVYHAASARPFAADTLAALPPADHVRLIFTVVPAVRWLQSPWPVLRIWEAHQQEVETPWQLRLDTGGQQVLVVRRGVHLYQEGMGLAEYRLLELLARGRPLGAAVECLMADGTELPDLERCFGHWAELGIFSGSALAQEL